MNKGTLHKYNNKSQTFPCRDKLAQCHRSWTVRAALADEFCRVMSASFSSSTPEMMKNEGHTFPDVTLHIDDSECSKMCLDTAETSSRTS